MTDAIKSSIIISLAESLDLRELGAATRILARLIEKKGPIPVKNAHLVAGLSKEEWEQNKEDILACFSHNETEIALTDAYLSIPKVAQDAQKIRRGQTAPLFPEQPKGHTPESLPSYLAKKPKGISIRAAIYDMGIRLLMGNNMTEKTARGVLSNLLMTYSAGDVAEAIEFATKEKGIKDPHSWMVAHLRQKNRKMNVRVRPGQDLNIVRAPISATEDDARSGMTSGTAQAIMMRNKALAAQRRGLFDTDSEDADKGKAQSQDVDSRSNTSPSSQET